MKADPKDFLDAWETICAFVRELAVLRKKRYEITYELDTMRKAAAERVPSVVKEPQEYADYLGRVKARADHIADLQRTLSNLISQIDNREAAVKLTLPVEVWFRIPAKDDIKELGVAIATTRHVGEGGTDFYMEKIMIVPWSDSIMDEKLRHETREE